MGTRADFYLGKGSDAEWLGSIGWDGYPAGIPENILQAPDDAAFRAAVAEFLSDREDGTKPEDGWPWPWNTSATTDYSYWHANGVTLASCFGHSAWPATQERGDDDEGGESFAFPDMSARKNVVLSGNRSGLIVARG
jgi:hypothetical protein